MKIFKFRPIYKTTLWGGNRIASFKNVELPEKNIGECWEISGIEGNESIVAEGEDAGNSLSMIVEKYGEKLVGSDNYRRFGNKFPLLIKLIDAARDLSIQVHPDDDLAKKRHNSLGKTEMWFVVDATSDATLLSGLKRTISQEEYVKALKQNTLVDELCRHDVRKGDCFYLPAGRIHSIGAGTLVAEIQETSDITYRLYDFNRKDADGNMRQLHTDLALDAIDYAAYDNYRTEYSLEINKEIGLVNCPYFTVSLYKLTYEISLEVASLDSYMIIIVCDGKINIHADEGDCICNQGETILIAANTKKLTFSPISESVQILFCRH